MIGVASRPPAHQPANAAGSRAAIVPVAFGLGCGMVVALQAFMNGRLGQHFGSSELAGVVNGLVSASGLIVICLATGALRRARQRVRVSGPFRWWHLAASMGGAVYIIVSIQAAPRIGVAMLIVGLVCGQTTGSLILDRIGLSSAGRQDLTPARVLAAAIAIAAVVLGALNSHGDFRPGLLALAVLGGALFSLAPVGVSQVTRVTGEPVVASLTNNAVIASCLIVIRLFVTGGSAPNGYDAPAIYWVTGGLCGVAGMIMLALAVSYLGVLRLTLAMVAGQAAGGLFLDLIAPPDDATVTLTTLVSLAMVFTAVAVSSLSQLRPTRDLSPLDPCAEDA